MLSEVPIKIIPSLNISYTYKYITTPFPHYIKDYNTKEAVDIKKAKIVETRLTSGANVVIHYYGNYYWCPIFDDLYKQAKQGSSRRIIESTLTVRATKTKVFVEFTAMRIKYKTTEVKRINIIK
jgi:hypothetical protein